MRILDNENGVIIIDNDQELVDRAADVDLGTIDVTGYRLQADVVSDLYNRALKLKTDESAAEYVKLRDLYIAKQGVSE